MNTPIPVLRLLALGAALATAASPQLHSQAVPAPGASGQASRSAVSIPADHEVVTLSPFMVAAEADKGYVATSTLAGTRLRTDLRDVGSAISVITEQFLTDTASRNVEDLLVYTTNTEIGGVYGNTSGLTFNAGGSTDETGSFTRSNTNNRVRGLGNADNTRDYFVSDIPWDGYNIGRVDMQRGPNSILFGLGNPAGVVNAGLNQASFRSGGKTEVRFDQFHSARGSLDYNQVLSRNELAVRFSVLDDSTKYRQEPAFNRDRRGYGALRYDPRQLARNGMRTTIRANYEHGEIDAMRPRVLPPIDRLSAWFNTTPIVSAANPLIGKPAVTYQPINRQVYNNWDATSSDNRATDPSVQFAAEGGRHWLHPTNPNTASKTYVAGYVLNPYYQPFISEVYTGGVIGFFEANGSAAPVAQYGTSGSTLQSGINNTTNDGPRLRATPLGLMADGGVGYFRYSQFQTIAEPWKTYRYLQMPFGGLWRDPSLTDPKVFDFFNTNLDGDNRRSWRNFNAFSAAVDQTFFNNRAGLNLAIDQQDYRDGSHSIFNDRTQTITVDLNSTFPAGNLPNPNAGRAVMVGDGNYNTRKSERDETRLTAFAELRATDLLRRGWLASTLGRHVFTGLASRNTYEKEDRSHRRFMLNPDDLVGVARNLGVSGDPVAFRTQVYLTPDSMQNTSKYPSMSSLHLQAPSAVIAPESIALTYFDSRWKPTLTPGAPGYINPSANTFMDPYSRLLSAERNNPANYVGWTTKQVRVLDATDDDDRDRMITSLNQDRMRISSKAFVWQGFLFDGHIVPTFGYREDAARLYQFQSGSAGVAGLSGTYRPTAVAVTVPGQAPTIFAANPGGVRDEAGFVIPNSPNIGLPGKPNKELSTINRSWSVVGHSPQFIRRYLPWGTALSLSYNESTNFNPNQAGRVNMWNQTIAPSQGKTRDVGLLVSTLQNRLNFRIVKYKAAITGNSASGFNMGQFKEIETRAWVGAKKMEDAIKAAETKDYLDNPIPGKAAYTSSFENPNYLYGTRDPADTNRILYANQQEKDALLARGRTMVSRVFSNVPRELFLAWGIPVDGSEWRNVTDIGTLPSGATTTQDNVSEGWEFELTMQPLKNWRISGNLSTTKAVRDNSFADIKEFLFDRSEVWNGPQGDFYYSNPGREATAYRDDWNTRVMPTLTTGILADGQAVQEAVRKRWNLVTTYEFDRGFLKDLSVGGGFRWEEKTAIGYRYMVYDYQYTSGGVKKTTSFEIPDLKQPIFGPEQRNLDLWIAYSRKVTEKIRWSIQLNVRNVGDKSKLVAASTQPDGSLAQYRIKEGQSWYLTNAFRF